MRWASVLLLLANLAVGAYLLLIERTPEVTTDVRSRELNADKVRTVGPHAPAVAGVTAPPADTPPATPAAQRFPAAPPSPSPATCLEWGSFTIAELERARQQLDRAPPDAVRVRELTAAPAWWVYVPPLRSRDEAERRVREIEAAGVTDVSLVSEGERWRNAISLGIFKTEEAANAYVARMRESKVRNVTVIVRNDLLRLAAIVMADPPPPVVTQVMELRTAFPGTEVKATACPAGAG